MSSLEKLSRKYVLDKNICTSWHNYIPIYTQLFEPIRAEKLRILEIGIGVVEEGQMLHTKDIGYRTGNSLRCWRDYFPNASVYGIDIYETKMKEDRIKTFVANQANNEQLLDVMLQIGGRLHIIIDDGSHQVQDQVSSFMFLSQFMANHSMYVIEDIQLPAQPSFKDLSVFPPAFQEYIRNHFDFCCYETGHQSPLQDDFLMVFLKK